MSILDYIHSKYDSAKAAIVRGDFLIGNSSGELVRLGIGANGKVLSSDGTDPSWQTPAGGAGSTSIARLFLHMGA